MAAVPINFQKLRPDAIVPEYGTEKSAGFDLAIPDDVHLEPGETKFVKLGLVIQAPVNHFILITPRSSTHKKWNVSLGNTIGIVDEDFCGPEDELGLMLKNDNPRNGWYVDIPAGTRLAQGLFIPVTRGVFVQTYAPISTTRGGWGSTG